MPRYNVLLWDKDNDLYETIISTDDRTTAETVAPQELINIGERNFVINWYINVPTPAPNRQELIGVPQILAISTVATKMLSTCCSVYSIHSFAERGTSRIS